jgi:hypothetical protein
VRRTSATGVVLLTLAAGQFLMTLDSAVMNVSIATVAKDVGTTVTGIQTAITLYTLVMASLMITGGKIGQIVGRKRAPPSGPSRSPGALRGHRRDGCRPRRRRRARDRDLADAARRPRRRGIGVAARQRHRVVGSRRAESEVGGLQNTGTNLGASIGTALAGAVLISTLSTSFFTNIAQDPAVPAEVTANATVELAAGIPFVSDADLQTALDDAGVPAATADAIVDENATARIDALRASPSVIAVIALIALFFTRRIPTRQPASVPVT